MYLHAAPHASPRLDMWSCQLAPASPRIAIPNRCPLLQAMESTPRAAQPHEADNGSQSPSPPWINVKEHKRMRTAYAKEEDPSGSTNAPLSRTGDEGCTGTETSSHAWNDSTAELLPILDAATGEVAHLGKQDCHVPAEGMAAPTLQEVLSEIQEKKGRRQRVVFARLTFNNIRVTNTILSFPALRRAISEVGAHGGQVLPSWAKGGIMLYPYDPKSFGQEGLIPTDDNGVDMGNEHIVFAADDTKNVALALLEIPLEQRPLIAFECTRERVDELLDSSDEEEHADAGNTTPPPISTSMPRSPGEGPIAFRLSGSCMSCGDTGMVGQCRVCGAPITNEHWTYDGGCWILSEKSMEACVELRNAHAEALLNVE